VETKGEEGGEEQVDKEEESLAGGLGFLTFEKAVI